MQEVLVADADAVVRVANDVLKLRGPEPYVQRMQHGTYCKLCTGTATHIASAVFPWTFHFIGMPCSSRLDRWGGVTNPWMARRGRPGSGG